jgi:hypothetical protein
MAPLELLFGNSVVYDSALHMRTILIFRGSLGLISLTEQMVHMLDCIDQST